VKYFSIANSYANEYMWISNDYTGNENWLRERAIHAQLSSVGSESGIVQYRGATSNRDRGDEKWLQRIYMEYCPHGDLMDLLCEHAKTDGRDPKLDENSQPIPQVRIPTRALWSFFKDLTSAACIMESGYDPLGNDYRAADDWEEIIHRDLKPGNIFLAAPLAKTSRGIPVCKLGDFGLAVPREYDPLRNPEDMLHPGTPGWKAPEFNRYPPDFEVSHELTSATDIWAIGRVMLALMELPVRRLPVIRYDDENEGRVDVQEKAQLVATHGEDLYGLVEKCLEPTPEDRIRAQHLLRAIDRQINNLSVPLPLELKEGDVLEYVQELRWAT
jgi:serine/threonine protein kinase